MACFTRSVSTVGYDRVLWLFSDIFYINWYYVSGKTYDNHRYSTMISIREKERERELLTTELFSHSCMLQEDVQEDPVIE